jgi:mRNA interferase MazF
MAQSIVKRGSVVLIRYPFTDLTGAKVRPALVVTPDHLLPRLEDVLCLFISSAMPDDLLPTDFALDATHPSFPSTGLKRRFVLRMHKLALLHKVLVLRVLGEGDQLLMCEVDQRLRLALGL